MLDLMFAVCCGFVFFILGVLGLFYIVSLYNGLIQLRENIEKAWSNIDVLLKQRSDLIPNLVSTVKGYMKQERKVLTEVTKLRTQVMKAKGPHNKAVKSERISAILGSLFAVSENYPKLKSNENFLKLQEQLNLMENQIADRREFYNNSVLLYNQRIKMIPDSFIAGILSMKEKEYFKADEKSKKNIDVKFEK